MAEKTLQELELEISSFKQKEEEIFNAELENPNSYFAKFLDCVYSVAKSDYKEMRDLFGEVHSQANPYLIAINNALSDKEREYQELLKKYDFK